MSILPASSPPGRWSVGRLSFWLIGDMSILLMLLIFGELGSQVIGNPVLLPLTLVKDIPLPSVLPDAKTQLIYVPLPDSGGRPVLRILRYNPSTFA